MVQRKNHCPASDGIVETLDTKFSRKEVASASSKKTTLAKTVTSKFHSDQCVAYEKMNENMLRSIDVYYAMGVKGKRNISRCVSKFRF